MLRVIAKDATKCYYDIRSYCKSLLYCNTMKHYYNITKQRCTVVTNYKRIHARSVKTYNAEETTIHTHALVFICKCTSLFCFICFVSIFVLPCREDNTHQVVIKKICLFFTWIMTLIF
jgi:hypothetical protein